jgi:hypothetical protein
LRIISRGRVVKTDHYLRIQKPDQLFMNISYIVLTIFILISSISMQDQKILFDGVSLDGWELIDFEGHGEISVADSCIIIGRGETISGIRWNNDFPKTNYEVNLEARRIEGSDFFCSVTCPVKESFVTLVIGGWGGSLVGLSSIDYYDAANNMTGYVFYFGSGHWYDIRLKVSDEKIEAWISKEKVVDFTIGNYKLSLRWEMESSIPFGITTYKTIGAVRNIRYKMITE